MVECSGRWGYPLWWGILVAAAVVIASASVRAEDQPTDGAAERYQQALAYFKAGAYDKAAEEFLKVYELDGDARGLFNAGLSFERHGDDERALESYEKYVAVDPDSEAADEARARILALRRAKERRKRIAALKRAGRDALDSEDYQEAIKAYREAFSLSNDAALVFKVAEAYRLDGDRDRAIAEYERYRRLAPTGRYVADALAREEALKRALARADEKPQDARPSDVSKAGQDKSPPTLKTAGLISAGLGAAAMGVSTFFAFRARKLQDDIEALDPDAGDTWSAESDEKVKSGEMANRIAIIGLAVGGAAVVTGGVLYFWSRSKDGQKPTTAVRVVPVLTPRQAWVSAEARF